MNMKTSGPVLLLFLCYLLCAEANFLHDDVSVSGCSFSDGEEMYGLDGEVIVYADFIYKRVVVVLPEFADSLLFPGLYEQAVSSQAICRQNLAVLEQVYKNPPVELDPPQSSIYPRDEVLLGEENSLICHVTGFHPAPVTVWWTRNNHNVTEGVTTSVPYINKDLTYYQFSSLKFTPEEGDIYSCSVEHRALSQPLTRIWDVEVSRPSIGSVVFRDVALILGLVGVATGIFFFIEGYKRIINYNQRSDSAWQINTYGPEKAHITK